MTATIRNVFPFEFFDLEIGENGLISTQHLLYFSEESYLGVWWNGKKRWERERAYVGSNYSGSRKVDTGVLSLAISA